MRRRFILLAAIAIAMAGSNVTLAADIEVKRFDDMVLLKISGAIVPGDLAKAEQALAAHGRAPDALQIESTGGDTAEAMRLGRYARQLMLPVTSGAICREACVLVWLGGVKRSARGPVGPAGDLADTPELRHYLVEMEVPADKADEWMAAGRPAMDADAAISGFGDASPAHREWMAEQCGGMTEQDLQDWRSVEALQIIEMSMSSMGGGGMSMAVPGPEIQQQAARAREFEPDYGTQLRKQNEELMTCRANIIREARHNAFDD